MKELSTQERIIKLEDAQEHIQSAITLIEQALKNTQHETHANAYIIGHLKNWIDSSRYDSGIAQYIDDLISDEFEDQQE